MSRSSSPPSPLSPLEDAKPGALPEIEDTANTDAGRLHALEQLEILPQILQEGILFAGSGAALLLQAAMPGIRATENETSKDLATELLDFLQEHISQISILVFGTKEERKVLLSLLKSQDGRFTHNPPVACWMAATLYATATDFYQRVYGRVDYDTAQRGYAEFSMLVGCMGMPEGVWPTSRTAFWSYWDEQIGHLNVSPEAARFAKELRESTDMPKWVQRIKPFLRVTTIEMLPPKIRDAYGLRSTTGTRALYRTWMGFSVAVYPAMPAKLRSYPLRYYQDRLKEKLNVV
ncbi:hypothetical protein N7488_009889 [Penicillium malachiteum]|nr:hypothetical protein N7488_009889 [Penicillium malachiteum]